MADKTIKEAAEILGVTPQAIYKVLGQANNDLIKHLTTTKKGNTTIKVIKPKGVELLKQRFNNNIEQTINKQFTTNSQDKTLEALIKQLEIKDNQIKKLSEMLEREQELHQRNQFMLNIEKQKALPEPSKWEKLKSVFKSNE